MKVKQWNVTLFSYNPDKQIKNDYFTTGDTEAFLKVRLTDKQADIKKVTFTLFNQDDESLISQAGTWEKNTAIFQMTNDYLLHGGKWIFQVVFEGDKKYISKPLEFIVKDYLLNKHPPKLEVIQNWDNLVEQAEFLVDELNTLISSFNELDKEINEYKQQIEVLLGSLQQAQFQEEIRKNNELKRLTDEIGRVDNEQLRKTQETTREQNESDRIIKENIRIQKENERVTNETNRQNKEVTREQNENNRKQAETGRSNQEDIRYTAEQVRIQRESTRQSNETSRMNAENVRIANENERIRTLAPRIASLETFTNNIKGWIIESGSNSRGEWIKFSDGIMIAWYGSPTKVYNVTTAWGSMFYNTDKISWDYPQAFIEAPRVIAEYNHFTGDAFVIRGGQRKSNLNSGDFYLLRPASGNAQGNLDFIAIGRWKY